MTHARLSAEEFETMLDEAVPLHRQGGSIREPATQYQTSEVRLRSGLVSRGAEIKGRCRRSRDPRPTCRCCRIILEESGDSAHAAEWSEDGFCWACLEVRPAHVKALRSSRGPA